MAPVSLGALPPLVWIVLVLVLVAVAAVVGRLAARLFVRATTEPVERPQR